MNAGACTVNQEETAVCSVKTGSQFLGQADGPKRVMQIIKTRQFGQVKREQSFAAKGQQSFGNPVALPVSRDMKIVCVFFNML
jgi:hypothetical protein